MNEDLCIPRFGERGKAHKPEGCDCSMHSAFRWAEFPRPSIFANEQAWKDYEGRSMAQIHAQRVDANLATYGRGTSIGWVAGTGPMQDPKKLAVSFPSRKGRAQ